MKYEFNGSIDKLEQRDISIDDINKSLTAINLKFPQEAKRLRRLSYMLMCFAFIMLTGMIGIKINLKEGFLVVSSKQFLFQEVDQFFEFLIVASLFGMIYIICQKKAVGDTIKERLYSTLRRQSVPNIIEWTFQEHPIFPYNLRINIPERALLQASHFEAALSMNDTERRFEIYEASSSTQGRLNTQSEREGSDDSDENKDIIGPKKPQKNTPEPSQHSQEIQLAILPKKQIEDTPKQELADTKVAALKPKEGVMYPGQPTPQPHNTTPNPEIQKDSEQSFNTKYKSEGSTNEETQMVATGEGDYVVVNKGDDILTMDFEETEEVKEEDEEEEEKQNDFEVVSRGGKSSNDENGGSVEEVEDDGVDEDDD